MTIQLPISLSLEWDEGLSEVRILLIVGEHVGTMETYALRPEENSAIGAVKRVFEYYYANRHEVDDR